MKGNVTILVSKDTSCREMGDREEYFSHLYNGNFDDILKYTDSRKTSQLITMKRCNGCGMTFGTFAELWDHRKLICKNLGNKNTITQTVQSTVQLSPQADMAVNNLRPSSPNISSNDLVISNDSYHEADIFPDDEKEGTYGYCVSYCLIPHGTWLKLDWLEKDPVEKGYKMCLSTRDNEKYRLWVTPRILLGLQRYHELLDQDRFRGKNIFFKYYGKKTISRDIPIHDFRLIIH